MSDEIEKMDLESENLVAERIEQLKQLFPEVVTEGDGTVDFEKLRLILGDDVAEDDERYAFTWPGKRDAIKQSQIPSTATLRPCPEKSIDWDTTQNLYIEGDNLEVLKLLQHSYHGKVKMIYIDPPYNTGHDFVYKDSFSDTINNYREQAGLAGQSNADTNGRYHSDWCSMMYPRLQLARELLSSDGVMFVSIDDNEVDNLKKLLDEIFGEGCFAARFMWTKTMTPPALSYKCRKTVEYVLCFEKELNKSKFFGDWLDNGDAPLLNSGNPKKRLVFPVHSIYFGFIDKGILSSGEYECADVISDISIIDGWNTAPVSLCGHFKWGQENLDFEVSQGTYFLAKTRKLSIRFQRAYSEESYKTPTNYLRVKLDKELGVGTNETASAEMETLGLGGVFDYTKPTTLIKQLIKMKCFLDKDDIICDFFSGSSSTADAVMQLNMEDGGKRKMISVQLPEDLDVAFSDADANAKPRVKRAIDVLDKGQYPHLLTEIGEERIRRAGSKIVEEVEESNRKLKLGEDVKCAPDVGFRIFKLDDSGIIIPDELTLADNVVKEDRTDEDIIFEMMLKWGLELTLPIERAEVAGYPCYSVAADELICCMAEGLTVEVLQAIANRGPRRVFMLDSVLTDTLKLNAVQIFKRETEKTGVEIELRTV